MKSKTEKLSNGLELMDWKAMEQEAENEIHRGKYQITVAEILLANAVIKIKELGGKTNAEIRAEPEEPEPNYST